MDYVGHDIGAASTAPDPTDCQRQCAKSASCRFFTFIHDASECWLKTKKTRVRKKSGLTSGPARCGDASSPATPVSIVKKNNENHKSHRKADKSSGAQSTKSNGSTALLLICYNRPKYLKRALDAVSKHLPTTGTNLGQLSRSNMPFFISQDGNHAGVASTIQSFIADNKDWNVSH